MRRRQAKSRMSAIAVVAMLAACSGASESPSTGESDPTAAPSTSEAPLDDEAATTSQPDAVEQPADSVPTDTEEPAPESTVDEPETRYGSGDASFLFDPDVVHTFDIELAEEALAELDSEPGAEEYVEGSLTFDGETLDRVGVRYKGSVGAFLGCTSGPNPFVPSGPKTCTKLSFKLRINWDGADTEFYGQRRIQLHAMNLDESLLRDRLGYEMFRAAGVPAPRATHARVNVNGEFVGLFGLVEQIDGRFTRDRFDDGTGNLYKEVWPFDDSGSVRPAEDLIASLRTNEDDDPDVDIVQSFARELLEADASSDPAAAREVLAARTELDDLIAYAVVDRAIRHDDGPFHWYCMEGPCEPHNFYVYEEPTSRRVHVIPWDLDNAFRLDGSVTVVTKIADEWGATSNGCEPFPFGPLNLPQRSAACDPLVAAWSSLDAEFAAADAAFRDGPFAPDNVRDLLDTWAAQIEPMVVEAAEAHDDAPTVEEWRAGIQKLIDDFVVPAEQEN